MAPSMIRRLVSAFVFLCACVSSAQESIAISAENLSRLCSDATIDFASFPDELTIGWFEANADASEFIVFDSDGRIYRVEQGGIKASWSLTEGGSQQIVSVIDAAYLRGEPKILYLLDDAYFINEQELMIDALPVAAHGAGDSLYVEVVDASGTTFFLEYGFARDAAELVLIKTISLPDEQPEQPAVRIGRIDFPLIITSALANSELTVYRYPDAFAAESASKIVLPGGPAVFGAVNGGAGSHLAWSDPASARLNLLDLETGENRMVAEIDGAYAQYHLLTADASAIFIVNQDFLPEVFAWDVGSGLQFRLGPYRSCKRIPDKVVLSADGSALIIGCDTGLDIWRIMVDEQERGKTK